MIVFYVVWLQTVFNVSKKDLILRISINNQHRGRIEVVEAYWCDLIGVSIDQFSKPSFIKTPHRKEYENNEHMGTLRVKVRKGTNMRREVLGAIAAVPDAVKKDTV